MEKREFCICQNQSHGHPPGECPYRATEADDLCKECHELSKKPEEEKRSSKPGHDLAGSGAPTFPLLPPPFRQSFMIAWRQP